jgi:hypothetical protein
MARNFYPEKPICKYQKTTVNMTEVIKYLQTLPASTEIKRAAYIIFRNESANGQSGINNNYAGIQCDSSRWGEPLDSQISGTVVKKENQTGKERLFAAFKDFRGSVDFLVDRVQKRGLYVGGTTHKILTMEVKTPADFVHAYICEWVTGDAHAKPSADQLTNLLSMYKQAQFLFLM